MIFQRNKYLVILLLLFLGCSKGELIEKSSNEFDADGKTFTYYPFGDSAFNPVTLIIPSGAVNRIHYCEYNSIYIDANYPLDSFEVNFLINDIHQLQSSATTLFQTATLILPFRQNISFSLASGYKPYKIKLTSLNNVHAQINEENRWTEINSFTFDNTSKTITFAIDDLNALYVIAKHL